MRNVEISRPVLIALVAAVVLGGLLLIRSQSDDSPSPPTPSQPPGQTGATGADAAPTASTGQKSAAELRRERRLRIARLAKRSGLPVPAYEALRDDKVVLVFYWNPKAQSDQETNQAVQRVKRERGKELAVFKRELSSDSRWAPLARAAEITQTPGIVMLYERTADSWQGYIDGAALNARIERLLESG